MEYSEQKIKMLSTSDVAWLLDTQRNTIKRWADAGIIKAYRNGGRDERFKREDVAYLLAKLGA
jgi:excisionase family DNA binding protein